MTDSFELRHLRVLVAVIDTGGLTRAADILGCSQSTVSETLLGLERLVGVKLIQRENLRTTATPAGVTLMRYARRILALADEASQRTLEMAPDCKRVLTIGAVESIGVYLLPPLFARLRANHPKMRIEVRTNVCAQIRNWLKEGVIEVGFVLEPTQKIRKRTDTVLSRTPLVLFGKSLHRRGKSFSVEQFQQYSFHLSDQAGSYHQALRAYFNVAGLPVPPLHSAGSVEGVKQAVLNSQNGLGVLPAFAIESEVQAGMLRALDLSPSLPILDVVAVLPPKSRKQPAPIVAQIISELQAVNKNRKSISS